jgi:hypothetical protein
MMEKPVWQTPQVGVHFCPVGEVSLMQAWAMLATSQ